MRTQMIAGLLIAGVSFLAGIGAVTLWDKGQNNQDKTSQAKLGQKLNPPGNSLVSDQKQLDRMLDNFFDQDFFNDRSDPFAQMQKMREHFKNFFNQDFQSLFDSNDFDQAFNQWYGGKFGGSLGEIIQREDQVNIYYDIQVENIDKNSLQIDISNGQVNISGKSVVQEKTEGDQSLQQMQMVSSFSRVLPVPPNVDEKKAEVKVEAAKIVIRFPKKIEVDI